MGRNIGLSAQKLETKITRMQLCPIDYSLSFDLSRTESRTYSGDIAIIHTPKERPYLVLHFSLKLNLREHAWREKVWQDLAMRGLSWWEN